MSTFCDFKDLLRIKRYSSNTITTYLGLLEVFDSYIGPFLEIHRLDRRALLLQVQELVFKKDYAPSTQRQLTSALKLYLKELHGIQIDFTSVNPKNRGRVLPTILSVEEVSKILNRTINLKHLAMLMTIYGLGLRSGELINLKVVDLDGQRDIIHVRSAKGNRDRILPFPKHLKEILRDYYKTYKPIEYLFEGQSGGAYTVTSLRKVFERAKDRAIIKKACTLHGLRHAYATHLMDRGTDVRIIKELLGHNSIKTTLIYTHVTTRSLAQVQSPLDFLVPPNGKSSLTTN